MLTQAVYLTREKISNVQQNLNSYRSLKVAAYGNDQSKQFAIGHIVR